MCKKIKKLAAIAAMAVQVIIMLLFGFTELQVSVGIYMAVWCVCAVFALHMLESREVI